MPPYARASPRMTSNRKTSPHQSLRDSFSSGRSRLAAHCLCFSGDGFGIYAEDGGVEVHQTENFGQSAACIIIEVEFQT